VTAYLAADRAADIDRRIVDAYTRQPPGDLIGFEAAGRRMVAAEPWDEPATWIAGRCGGTDV
jgi:hypothetical protein